MTIANKVLHVVAAAIFNKQGNLLIAQRPLDKHMIGFLEFSSGKVEAGEAINDALCCELDEESGIQPLSWDSLISIEHTYPEKKFSSMSGASKIFMAKPMVGKGRSLRWVAPNMLDQFEFPEANHGIIEALNIQKMYSGNIVIHPTF